MSEVIVFSWDHAGYLLAEPLIELAREMGYTTVSLGKYNTEPVDYPECVASVVSTMRAGKGQRGVLICGSGIGMSMAANRYKDIRAAVCTSECEARTARAHNNANILCLGARVIGESQAKSCLQVFLTTPFAGGRHQRRVEMIDTLAEQGC
ncbi:MAG: ribose 5-phosphate isomerase B [Alphaproteobacteria bacterium]